MKSYSRGRKISVIILGVILLVIVAAFIWFKSYTGRFYTSEKETIDKIEKELEAEVSSFYDEKGAVYLPKSEQPRAVMCFYPGGKVEYSAYSGLMYKLASRGYLCILPKMPKNLALLNIKAIDDLLKARSEEQKMVQGLDWYLAGHSLGGVAASKYLEKILKADPDRFDGLILCASYTTEDFSGADIRLLSIYGERDKVLNMKSYEQSKTLWPRDSTEIVIQGGIHSYFGSYGIQDGDGEPAISDEQQLEQTAEVIDSWISGK